MKKVMMGFIGAIAIACAASAARAEESYLYWMIDQSSDAAPIDFSYAMINLDGTGYLSLYYGGSEYGTQFGNANYPELGQSMGAAYAGAFNIGDATSLSFLVELYGDNDTLVGERQFDVVLADFASHIYSAGMAAPLHAMAVGQFRAVPEPTSGLLMLIGMAGLALRRKRA